MAEEKRRNEIGITIQKLDVDKGDLTLEKDKSEVKEGKEDDRATLYGQDIEGKYETLQDNMADEDQIKKWFEDHLKVEAKGADDNSDYTRMTARGGRKVRRGARKKRKEK